MWTTVLISCYILYHGTDTVNNSLDRATPQKREVEVIEWKKLYKPLHIIPRRKVKPRYNKRYELYEKPLYYLAPPWDDLKHNLA